MNTEDNDPRYEKIETWPTRIAVDAMLEAQLAAVATLKSSVEALSAASDAAADRLKAGGRLAYAGAGTSGRIAVQDGAELVPTFNWPSDRLVFLLAGGDAAMTRSIEGAEDDVAAAAVGIAAANIGRNDVVIGVAASGRTPYTVAAVREARAAGALTIAVANNADTPLLAHADHPIVVATGPEVIAGSTRMKAGTAQKVALNLLSTAIMLRCGLVHHGLMVNMRVSNDKLVRRAREMVSKLAGAEPGAAERALALGDGDIKRAVLIAGGLSPGQAIERLARAEGNLGQAISNDRSNA